MPGKEVSSGLIYRWGASGAVDRSRLFGGSASRCCDSAEPRRFLSEGVSQLTHVAASSTPIGLDGGGDSASLALMVEQDA